MSYAVAYIFLNKVLFIFDYDLDFAQIESVCGHGLYVEPFNYNTQRSSV